MKQDKRELIIESVIEMINSEGIAGISMSKIAKQAGISVATTYLYFENKDDMLRQSYLDCKEKMNHFMLSQLPENKTSEKKAVAFMGSLYKFAIEYKNEMNVIQQFRNSPMLELLELEHHKLTDEFSRPWIDIFAQGVKEGVFRDLDPEGMCYYCYFSSIGYIMSSGDKEYEAHHLKFDDLIEMTLRAIKKSDE